MKLYKFILLTLTAVILLACQKDPMSEIKDGTWNKERNIIEVSFSGQIGKSKITRAGNVATVEFLDYSDDFSNIQINSLEISYGATTTVKIGDKLNFNNTEKTATVTISPANGEPLVWKIKASLYVNPYKGTWGIQSFRMKWDDWNGWGLKGEAEVALKMTNAAPGIDDIITFGGIDGVDASGAYYGVYERTSGADGKFGTYVSSKGTDYSDKFGQLPNGKGKYFINPDNSVSVAIDGSTKKYNSNGSKTTDGITMNFDLKATQIWTIDWNDYYGNENQFKMTYQLWYILKKK